MSNFPTAGTCPNCSFIGELEDRVGASLGEAVGTLIKSVRDPFWGFKASTSYNGTRLACPKCGQRLIECNTCHSINLDRTSAVGDQSDCRSCGRRIT